MPEATVFSQELMQLMNEKSFSRTGLSQQIFVDRATLFRYLKGHTLPSEATVSQIAKAMRLTPAEFRRLLLSWEITANGGIGKMQQRDYIRAILSDPFVDQVDGALPTHPYTPAGTYLSNSVQVRQAIMEMFTVPQPQEFHKVFISTQSDHPLLWGLLGQLPPTIRQNLRIEHIIQMSDRQDDAVNISLFQSILPFLVPYDESNIEWYQVRYYYNHNLRASAQAMDWFPNVLFTEHMALLLSHDYSGGVVLRDNPAAYFRTIYNNIREHTWPMISEALDLAAFSDLLARWDAQSRKSKYVMMPQPCAFECLDEAVLNQLISLQGDKPYDDVASASFVARLVRTLVRRVKSREANHAKQKNTYLFYSDAGLNQVFANGLFQELEGLPFTVDRDMVHAMLDILKARSEAAGSRFISKALPEATYPLTQSGLCLVGLEQNMLILWRMTMNKPFLRYVIIEEKSIVNAFDDFFLKVLAQSPPRRGTA